MLPLASRSIRIVSPSTMSSKRTLPGTSERIGMEYGFHSQRTVPSLTFLPSLTRKVAPVGTGYDSISRPRSSTRRISPFRVSTICSPEVFLTDRIRVRRTSPAFFDLISDSTDCLLTLPPMWNVRIVNWVPGSPMLCAAMIPTAIPSSTKAPVDISIP